MVKRKKIKFIKVNGKKFKVTLPTKHKRKRKKPRKDKLLKNVAGLFGRPGGLPV